MKRMGFVFVVLLLVSNLLAWDYESDVIDVRSDPRVSGGEPRFLPYYMSVCIDQPPLVVDLNLPCGSYCVDAYIRYYPCDQDHEIIDVAIGNHVETVPDQGCINFRWFHNIGECGEDCGGDPPPLNFHNTLDDADLVFTGAGWSTEGVNIVYVKVYGNYCSTEPPVVTDLTPSEGEFADDIILDATSYDPDGEVLSEEYQYSLNGVTWYNISTTSAVDDPYTWTSGLNECDVFLRARAYDGEFYSEWFEVGPILIDNTPPTTVNNAPAGWKNEDFNVLLQPDDGVCGSGFNASGGTYYSIDGAAFLEGTEILFSESGIYTVQYYSVDDVSNEEDVNEFTVYLDKECVEFTDWNAPDINSSWGAEECVTYTGREDIVYLVDIGTDPTCGLTGIKFEDPTLTLGDDGVYEADIFQFFIPIGTLPAEIEVATKAGPACAYTIFTAADCGVLSGSGEVCETGPDDLGFTIQLLAAEDMGDGTMRLTFRVVSDHSEETAALSHVTFGVPEPLGMDEYTTIYEFTVCTGGGTACAEVSLFIGDALSGVDNASINMYYGFAGNADITDPDLIEWTLFSSETSGNICEPFSEHADEYLYIMTEAGDIAGNECFSLYFEYIDVFDEPIGGGCGEHVFLDWGVDGILRDVYSDAKFKVYGAENMEGPYVALTPYPITASQFSEDLFPNHTRYYYVTMVNEFLEEMHLCEPIEVTTYEATVNGLSYELLPENSVRFSWTDIPEVSTYRIYYGETDINYASPIATITDNATWTTPAGLLEAGATYNFGLRVVTDCGCIDENYTTVVHLAPHDDPASAPLVAVSAPACGKRISGDLVTIVGTPLNESITLGCVLFQYKLDSEEYWYDLPGNITEGPGFTGHDNPDRVTPYFVHWNTTFLMNGTYYVRAVGMDEYGIMDENPAYISLIIDHDNPGYTEWNSAESIDHYTKTLLPSDRIMPLNLGYDHQDALITANVILFGDISPSYVLLSQVDLRAYPTTPLPNSSIAFSINSTGDVDFGDLLINLNIKYDTYTCDIPGNQRGLVLYRYLPGGVWEIVPSEVDVEYNRLTATLDAFGVYAVLYDASVGIGQDDNLPKVLTLFGNRPNPFNATTAISYYLPTPMNSKITIYNIFGEELTEINPGIKEGMVTILWNGDTKDGTKVGSGIYLYRFMAGDKTFTRKMMLLK
ncbi:T9SS type A sorting domain-containing protein [bacterium]|nr:T9SS type A sorting domain-containing protein [bacterium]